MPKEIEGDHNIEEYEEPAEKEINIMKRSVDSFVETQKTENKLKIARRN